MAASSVQATSAAAAQVQSASRDWTGWCLMFVRLMLGVAMNFPSAISAWKNAKYKHTTGTPPKGVPVFWDIGKHGHVALSDGGGYCYSTDILRKGKVDRVPISKIASRWGARYLGWTEDLNGVRVYTPPSKPATAKPSTKQNPVSLAALRYHATHGTGKYSPASSGPVCEGVKRRLIQLGCGTDASSFASCYAAWQRKLGYTGKDADGIPGMASLKTLAATSNWTVVA